MRLISEDRSTPVVSAPYRAVVVRGGGTLLRNHHDLARELGLSEQVFLDILAQVPERVQGMIVDVDVHESVPTVRLEGATDPFTCDGNASFGEIWTVLLESAIALAKILSEREAALLLIDEPEAHLHPGVVHRLMRLIGERTSGFQTVVVSHALLPEDVRRGWSEIKFARSEVSEIKGTARLDTNDRWLPNALTCRA